MNDLRTSTKSIVLINSNLMDIRVWLNVFLLIISVIIITATDYYEILGVKRDATEKEIKRKFRQLGKMKPFNTKSINEKIFA